MQEAEAVGGIADSTRSFYCQEAIDKINTGFHCFLYDTHRFGRRPRLPLLMTLKIRRGGFGEVIELIKANNLGEDFAAELELDVRGKSLELLRKAGHCA